ncbi:MAG: exodeoxyribonuclease VII small subunit [Ezakiella sp.]|nr:exodeoxyribonuclease VII small subunit [Ezakiella sp.]MDD7471875.1 exodeoxyribonuclease VII small subunit [Bacillota bacterium]MDY3923839.1 exodeoxyribonuclease VII small subunit [Ezakiella sp.]
MKKDFENFSYEDSIKRINYLIDKMENNDIGLSENIENFKEAKSLINKCNEYLKEMKNEFELIIANDQFLLDDFPDESEDIF